jgi:hypothetical protein
MVVSAFPAPTDRRTAFIIPQKPPSLKPSERARAKLNRRIVHNPLLRGVGFPSRTTTERDKSCAEDPSVGAAVLGSSGFHGRRDRSWGRLRFAFHPKRWYNAPTCKVRDLREEEFWAE